MSFVTTTELLENDASTVVTTGGTTAPAVGTVENWVVTSPGNFGVISANQHTQVRVVDLLSTNAIKGGEIMLATDSWATTLTSALTVATAYTSLAVTALAAAMSAGDVVVLDNQETAILYRDAAIAATSLSLYPTTTAYVTSAANASTSTTITVAAPTDLVPGNMIVISLYTATSNYYTVVPPGFSYVTPGGSARMWVYYKIITDSEPAYTFTGTVSNIAAAAVQIAGAGYVESQFTVSDVTGTALDFVTGESTIFNNDLLLLVVGSQTGKTYTTPSGTTTSASVTSSGVIGVSTFYDVQVTAGTVATYTSTASASDTMDGAILVFRTYPEWTAGYSHSIGGKVTDLTQSSPNVNWVVTRGYEPLVKGGTAATVVHAANFTATNTLTVGALTDFLLYQPTLALRLAGVEAETVIVESELELLEGVDLVIDEYSTMNWTVPAGEITITAGTPVSAPTILTNTLNIFGPGSSAGIQLLNDAIGIGAMAPVTAGTLATAPPPSSAFNVTPGPVPALASGDFVLVAAATYDLFTAGPTSPYADWNQAGGVNPWIWTYGLDVAWQTLTSSSPGAATWTMTDSTFWACLSIALISSGTLSMVQYADAGSFESSGIPATVFSSNTMLGNTVVLALATYVTGETISSISSSIGTFAKVCAYVAPGSENFNLEWWVCLDVTGTSTDLTITTSNDGPVAIAGFEIAGGATAAYNAGVTMGTSTAPSLTPTLGAFVQQGDSGSSTVSGRPATFLGTNVTIGDAVAVLLLTAEGTISVTSSIGTFHYVGLVSTGFLDMEWWVCPSATGASNAITATTVGDIGYYAAGFEIRGPAVPVGTQTSSGTSTAPSLDVAGADNNFVFVATLAFDGAPITAAPTTPWFDYNGAGILNWADGIDMAWISGTSSTETATWTASTGGWITLGLVLTPATEINLGSPWLNTNSFDVLVKITVTAGTCSGSPVIKAGVGSSSTPGVNAITGIVASDTVNFLGDFKVPAGYWLLINNTGSLGTSSLVSWIQAA